MALEALGSGDMRLWQMNGGDWYVKGDARQRADVDRLLAHCRRLPLIIEVQCEKARHVIAHADYPAPVYRWQQPVDPQRVLWSRHRLSEHLAGRHGAYWRRRPFLVWPYAASGALCATIINTYIDTGAVVWWDADAGGAAVGRLKVAVFAGGLPEAINKIFYRVAATVADPADPSIATKHCRFLAVDVNFTMSSQPPSR